MKIIDRGRQRLDAMMAQVAPDAPPLKISNSMPSVTRAVEQKQQQELNQRRQQQITFEQQQAATALRPPMPAPQAQRQLEAQPRAGEGFSAFSGRLGESGFAPDERADAEMNFGRRGPVSFDFGGRDIAPAQEQAERQHRAQRANAARAAFNERHQLVEGDPRYLAPLEAPTLDERKAAASEHRASVQQQLVQRAQARRGGQQAPAQQQPGIPRLSDHGWQQLRAETRSEHESRAQANANREMVQAALDTGRLSEQHAERFQSIAADPRMTPYTMRLLMNEYSEQQQRGNEGDTVLAYMAQAPDRWRQWEQHAEELITTEARQRGQLNYRPTTREILDRAAEEYLLDREARQQWREKRRGQFPDPPKRSADRIGDFDLRITSTGDRVAVGPDGRQYITVQNDSDFERVQPGAMFVDPEGTLRRKPY